MTDEQIKSIRERLAAAQAERGRLSHITLMLYDEDATPIYAPAVANLMTTAPTDIADLIAEVSRLRTALGACRKRESWRIWT